MKHYLDYEEDEKLLEPDSTPMQKPLDAYWRIDLPSLPSPDDNSNWVKDSACLDHPEVDFFDYRQTSEAKAICADCLVVTECLDFALRNEEGWGVWGGMKPEERKVILRSRTG